MSGSSLHAQARESKLPLQTLDALSAGTLEALGEILLPGSARAGLAIYIDHQLSGKAADSLLMLKYLRVNPPYRDFYLPGLAAARDASTRQFGKPPEELDPEQGRDWVTRNSAGGIEGWRGPPERSFTSFCAMTRWM